MSDTTNIDTTTTETDATTTPPAAPAEPSPEDVFANAFAEFASPGEKKDDVVSPPVALEEPAEEQPAAEPVAEEQPAEPAPAQEPPAEEKRQPTPEEVQAYYAAIAQQQAQQQAPQQEQPPLLAQEEVAALNEFRKEWPDVAKAVDIQSKVLAHQVIDYVFKEFAKEITPKLQQLEDLAERTHFEDVYNAVDDYDDIRDKVIQWVGQQPDYLRNAYGYVVQYGTPEQIADLTHRWRVETGQMQQQAPARAAPPPPRQPSPAVRQAAAALAPVSSKRSNVTTVDDPNDFDAAFSRFAKERVF